MTESAGPTPPPPRRPSGASREQINSLVGIAATVLAVLLLIAVANRGGSSASRTSTTDDQTAASSGEIFRQASDEPGPNVFTASVSATPDPTATHVRATPTATSTASTPGSSVQVQSQLASTPGLYGGTRNISTCDSGQLVTFLRQNPGKASAWVRALNADPTLSWSGGSQVTVDQISAYVGELTPVLLRSDTRVTNHGFVNGNANPYQSVLQAGTAVLVDRYGVPRVRCACGNPLTRPVPVRTTPSYTGPQWQGFSPTTVVVVQPPPVVITTIVLVDVRTGDTFARPAGTTGASDGPAPSPQASPSPTPSPSPSASPSGSPTPTVHPETHDVSGTYDLTFSASGGGGECFAFSVQVTMTVQLTGGGITMTIAGSGASIVLNGSYHSSDGSFSVTGSNQYGGGRYEGSFDSSGGVSGTISDTGNSGCSGTLKGHHR